MAFTIDISNLSRSLSELEQRQLAHSQFYAQTAAKELEAFARADAPWRDHSGHARGGITGRAERRGNLIIITLSGSVRYLTYLELAHGKKWAVLWPTMQKNAQRILRGFAKIGGAT